MTTTIQYRRVDVKNLTDTHVKHKLSLIKPLVFEGHSFVAGGVFKTIFADGEDFGPKDIDVFFHSSKDHTEMLNKFTKLSNLENPPYVYSHANANTISYQNVETKVNVDLIMREYGTPEHIMSGFDFTCVKCAAVVENGEYRLVYHPRFLQDSEKKVLNYDSRREFDADSVFNRMVKYIQYGYTPSPEFKQNLFRKIKHFDGSVSDPKVTKY